MPKIEDRGPIDQYFRTDHLTAEIGGRTARGGVVTILSHGLKFGIGILATSVLARLLTPQDYGLIAMVAVATSFVSMFKDLGLSLATVQRAEINYNQISTLFWVNVTLSVAIMLLMVVLAPGVAWFYGEPRLTMITVGTAIGFVFGGLAVQHEALLKRQMRFYALSAIAFLSMTFGYVVGIVFAWHGFHYWSLVLAQLTLLATNAIGVWVVCQWRPGRPRPDPGTRSMLSFGGNVTGYALINYFSRNSDNLLIGRFFGPLPLGLYNKAAQLLALPTDQVNEPLNSVVIPALSRLADSPTRYRQAYLRIMEKVILLTMPAVTIMIASSDWLVQIILGSQWNGTARILVYMGIAGLFQPIANTGGWLLVTQGRVKDMLHWSLINAPISILSILAGLRWGAVGVAASFSLTRILVANPLLFWFVGRSGPVRMADFYRLLTPFTLGSAFSLAACLAFRKLVFVPNPVVGVLICAIIVALTTLFILFLVPAGRKALLDIKSSIVLLRAAESDVSLRAPE